MKSRRKTDGSLLLVLRDLRVQSWKYTCQICRFMMSWYAATTLLRTCTSCWNETFAFASETIVSSRVTFGSPSWKRSACVAAAACAESTRTSDSLSAEAKSTPAVPSAAAKARDDDRRRGRDRDRRRRVAVEPDAGLARAVR